MSNLYDKRILFIGIGFYDYEQQLKSVMESEGAIVQFIISVYRSFFSRFFNLLHLSLISKKIDARRLKKEIESTDNNNDIVFIIKGQNLQQSDIILLKKKNPNAKFVLYLWDSLIRHENKDLLLSSFDNIWSFDRIDCQNEPRIKFRPLFYRNIPKSTKKIYAVSFIGWMHSDRLAIVRKLKADCKKSGDSYFLKLYMAPFSYFMERYVKCNLTKNDRDLIILKPISYLEFQKITLLSNAVIDISHPLQSGLTIRTIETLACGCHLLTTNNDIINYLNIDSSQYTIIERNAPTIPCGILTVRYNLLSDFYSIENFLFDILLK